MGRRRRGVDPFEQISIRVPRALLERADTVAKDLEVLPDFGHDRGTRATVLRVALTLGLRDLERRIAKAES
jgi:hypothetical protein